MTTDYNSDLVPLYQQIKEKILRSLDDAVWSPGQLIPSATELAQLYNVSPGTVRRVIDELAAANILICRQGSGTYVATHAQRQVSKLFLKIFADNQPESNEWFLMRRYLHCELTLADDEIREKLQISKAIKTVKIIRQLYTEQQLVMQDYIWIPQYGDKFELTLDYLNVTNKQPLYGLLEDALRIRFLRSEEKLKALILPKLVAKEMNIEPIPVLQIQRISYTYNSKPIEYRNSYCVTDNHYYKSKLN